MSDLICNACQIQIHSDEERASHYKSEWHRYNVKRRCAGLASIPQKLFDQQLTALNAKKAQDTAQKASQNCKTCKKSFATASAYQAHIASKKHLKKVEKQGDNPADEDDDEEESEKVNVKAAASASAAVGSSASASAQPAESKADEETDDALEEGEEEEEGEPIPLLHCLFCSTQFTAIESSVDHMLKKHGFFIPFIENLVDLEGLLTYLGEKIGIGHVCLWCNGKGKARYPSTQAVQNHMSAKSHCKLALEDDEDEEELMDFYDFDLEEEEEDAKMTDAASTSSSSSSTSSALVVVQKPKEEPKRVGGGGAAGINDAGELVLSDGSIVGSRQNKHLYKQHVRPQHDLKAIAQHYKQLALTTNVKENPRIYRKKREAFHLRRRKREDLAKGLGGNFQFHFRAQVSY